MQGTELEEFAERIGSDPEALRRALRAFEEADAEAFKKLGESAEKAADAIDAMTRKPLPQTNIGHKARRQERRRLERAALKR